MSYEFSLNKLTSKNNGLIGSSSINYVILQCVGQHKMFCDKHTYDRRVIEKYTTQIELVWLF